MRHIFAASLFCLVSGFCKQPTEVLANSEPNQTPSTQMQSRQTLGMFYASTQAQLGVESLQLVAFGYTNPGTAGRINCISTGPKLLIEQVFGIKEVLALRLEGSGTWGMSSALPSLWTDISDSASVNTKTNTYRAQALVSCYLTAIANFLSFEPYIGYTVYHYRTVMHGFDATDSPDLTILKLRFYSPKVGLDVCFTPAPKAYLRFGVGIEFPHAFLRTADLQDGIYPMVSKTKLTCRRQGLNALVAAGYQVTDFLGLNAKVEFYSTSANGPSLPNESFHGGNYLRTSAYAQATAFTMGMQLSY